MKCGACGYEQMSRHVEWVPVLYKIGPKKGTVRTHEYQTVEEVGDEPFEQIGFLSQSSPYTYSDYTEMTQVFACPKCHTIRKKDEG